MAKKLVHIFYSFILVLFVPMALFAQATPKKETKKADEVQRKNFVSFGIEAGPLIPTGLFNKAGTQITNQQELIRFTLKPTLSYRFGGALRFDIFNFRKMRLGNVFTFNTGIFYTQRAYRVFVDDVSNPVQDVSLIQDKFRWTSFEVPLMLQLHLQASNRIWVNFAVGTGLEFYPSQVYTTTAENEDGPMSGQPGYYLQYTARKFILLAPLKASVGVEYRTEKSGYFGIGVSISRPIPYMADTYLEYWKQVGNDPPYRVSPYDQGNGNYAPMQNQGMYMSIDLRYYFQPSRNEKEVVPSYIRDRNKVKRKTSFL